MSEIEVRGGGGTVALADLVNRVMDRGVVASGGAMISVADVELLYLDLNVLLASVETLRASARSPGSEAPRASRRTEGTPVEPGARPSSGRAPAAAAPDPREPGEGLPERRSPGPGRAMDRADPSGPPARPSGPADDPGRSLGQLVLTVVEFLRRVLEHQAVRRMEAGSLTEEEEERLGLAFLRLQERILELKNVFGVEDEELNLDLGPLGRLL